MFVHTLFPAAWQLLQRLGQEPWLCEFYLAGGSAAALHLGHRVSVDLDFFTAQEYDPDILSRQLQRIGQKLIAVGQRGTKRDFVDLYFICQSGWQLADLLQRVPQKYRTVSYPSYHLLRALVYFEDAEDDVSPQMLVEWDWAAVKEFFTGEVQALMHAL